MVNQYSVDYLSKIVVCVLIDDYDHGCDGYGDEHDAHKWNVQGNVYHGLFHD
jgi:hypothetical protein